MTWVEFVIRLLLAFILGAAIGIERQWQKTRAVLKMNVLVCIGAAMFVMMSSMVANDSSPTRVAAQVVSGIGFLGGGLILREGTSVRGNTVRLRPKLDKIRVVPEHKDQECNSKNSHSSHLL